MQAIHSIAPVIRPFLSNPTHILCNDVLTIVVSLHFVTLRHSESHCLLRQIRDHNTADPRGPMNLRTHPLWTEPQENPRAPQTSAKRFPAVNTANPPKQAQYSPTFFGPSKRFFSCLPHRFVSPRPGYPYTSTNVQNMPLSTPPFVRPVPPRHTDVAPCTCACLVSAMH